MGLIAPWHTACGILVPWPGTEPTSSALQGGFLTTEHQRSPCINSLYQLRIELGRLEQKAKIIVTSASSTFISLSWNQSVDWAVQGWYGGSMRLKGT